MCLCNGKYLLQALCQHCCGLYCQQTSVQRSEFAHVHHARGCTNPPPLCFSFHHYDVALADCTAACVSPCCCVPANIATPCHHPHLHTPQLVIDKLTRRALHSELSVTPCPHQVLFDFLTAWGNYKAAAAAMLSHARRLRAAGAAGGKQRRGAALQETVEEVMAAYGEWLVCCCLHDWHI